MLALARKFSLFNDIHTLNSVVNTFKEAVRGFVPKSLTKVIDFLATHSAKIKGVSFATYEYMADKTGLSSSTLKRAIKRLIELGFIQVINVWIDGRQKANVYQIQANIDIEQVAEQLIGKVRFEFFTPADDTVNESDNETENDTLCEADEPKPVKDFPSFLKKGSSKAFQAVQAKKDNEYIMSSESFLRLLEMTNDDDNNPFNNSILIRS